MESDTHPTTTTTIPSDPTIDTPSKPEKAPRPSNPTLVRNLRLLLQRYITYLLRTTDRNLVRLTNLLSSPATTDNLLCTLSYTLELTHALSSRLLDTRLTALASKADEILLLPGETLIASLPAPPSTKALAHVVGTSKALAGLIGDFRIFVRLWGLMGLYSWARSTYLTPIPTSNSNSASTSRDKLLRRITWAQIVSCVLFQVYENGAYLSSKGALTHASWAGQVGKARESWWWVVSSRWWAAHVFLELLRLGVVWVDSSGTMEEGEKIKTVGEDGEKEAKLWAREKRRADQVWWRDLVSNLAYAPMTLHWSVPEGSGFLSNWGVGLCGMVAGGSLLVDAWRQTA